MAALAKDLRLTYERVEIPTPIWHEGSIVHGTGVANEVSGSSMRFSDFIQIDASMSHMLCSLYTASSTADAVAFYDAEKHYIKGIFSVDNLATRDKSYPIEIPYNAAYVRFTIYGTVLDQWFGEYYKGDVISAIERVKHAAEWNCEVVRILNNSSRNTNAVYTDALNVEDVGAVSLRLESTFNCVCKIGFVYDDKSDRTDMMMDVSGNAVQFDVQPGFTIITAEDAPVMKCLRWLKMKITFITAPTTGSLKVFAVQKR